jgi:DNA-binding NarL/FixJ family response regulator
MSTIRFPRAAVTSIRAVPSPVFVEPEPIRVLVADAHPVVHAGFEALFSPERDIAVVGAARNAQEAITLACRLRPDVALIDLDLAGLDDGLQAARRIHEDRACAEIGVIIVASDKACDETLLDALRAGASAFVRKSMEPEQLMEAVRVVAAGGGFLSPAATRRLISAYRCGALTSPCRR